MMPKQRFLAAMNFRQPTDMVAMMEIEFQIYEEYVGEPLTVGFEYSKLSAKEKERALHRNAELMIMTAQKADHDAINGISGYWEVAPGVPAFLWLPNLEDRLELIRILKKISGDEFFLLACCAGFIGIPDGDSIYDFVDTLYEDPDGVHAYVEKNLTDSIEVQKKFIEAGADGIGACTDIAFNTGTFLSPKQLDEFLFPYVTRWAESVRKEGLVSIWHTDGNLNDVMDRIAATGVTALQCVDPLASMDIIELKKKYHGKLALIGNLDCAILQFGPEEAVTEASRHIIEGCKEGGGFAFGGCNAIFKGIPANHYQAMVDARRKYGAY